MATSNRLMYGTICINDIWEAIQSQHSSMTKSDKNGKVYASVKIWINPEPDKYGNNASVQLSPKKDTEDQSLYIGNLRWSEIKEQQQATVDDLPPLGAPPF